MTGTAHRPLILTAAFDPGAAAVFQNLRERYFPPKLNIVPAHLTLFHCLPGSEHAAIEAVLQAECAVGPPAAFAVTGLRFLGRGVALEIACARLVALRRRLAAPWTASLTAQDAQGFRPHVTIQNKVGPTIARALRDRLAADPPSLQGAVIGLDLWHYDGGPWQRAGHYPFRAGNAV